jgi:hypothetical protein
MRSGKSGRATEPTTKAGTRAVSLAVVAILLFGMLTLAFMSAGNVRAAYVPDPIGAPIEPNPELEGNLTISTHYSHGGLLTYPNGSSNATLAAQLDPHVVNPISVVPTGIVSAGLLQADKVAGSYWNATGSWATSFSGASCGQADTGPAAVTANGEPAVDMVLNSSSHCGTQWSLGWHTAISSSLWPSSTPSFDYLTIGGTFAGTCLAGVGGPCAVYPYVANASGSGNYVALLGYNAGTGAPSCTHTTGPAAGSGPADGATALGSQFFYSISFAQIETACGVGLNVSGPGATSTVTFGFYFQLTKATGTADTFTVTDLALSTSAYTFGTTTWHKTLTPTRQAINGTANLTMLAPSFSYTTLSGGALTLAVVQPASDLPSADVTTTIAAINEANATAGGPSYVEQVDYFFTYGFPVASGLSYGAFKLADNISLSGAQYVSVSYGGTAYTSTYQAYPQGKPETVQSAVTPTTAATWFGVVDYTGAQWDSIATAPGFFSAGGVEYWWFILIGAIIAIAGGSSAWVTSNERALRVRRNGTTGVFFGGPPRARRLRADKQGKTEARHVAAISIGLIFVGAGAIGVWAFYDGADYTGAAGAFVAGLLLLLALAAIIFVVYEVVHRLAHRHRGG